MGLSGLVAVVGGGQLLGVVLLALAAHGLPNGDVTQLEGGWVAIPPAQGLGLCMVMLIQTLEGPGIDPLMRRVPGEAPLPVPLHQQGLPGHEARGVIHGLDPNEGARVQAEFVGAWGSGPCRLEALLTVPPPAHARVVPTGEGEGGNRAEVTGG